MPTAPIEYPRSGTAESFIQGGRPKAGRELTLNRAALLRCCHRHVWMAPGWQGFDCVLACVVTCSHVSGLLSRHKTAGPDGIRGSNSDHGLGVALPHDGWQVSFDPSFDRHCHHACSPSQAGLACQPRPDCGGLAAPARRRQRLDMRFLGSAGGAVSSSRPPLTQPSRAVSVRSLPRT